MKFLKDGFKGVVNGDVYPTVFKKGDECPEELERAAVELEFVKGEPKSNGNQPTLLPGELGVEAGLLKDA